MRRVGRGWPFSWGKNVFRSPSTDTPALIKRSVRTWNWLKAHAHRHNLSHVLALTFGFLGLLRVFFSLQLPIRERIMADDSTESTKKSLVQQLRGWGGTCFKTRRLARSQADLMFTQRTPFPRSFWRPSSSRRMRALSAHFPCSSPPPSSSPATPVFKASRRTRLE